MIVKLAAELPDPTRGGSGEVAATSGRAAHTRWDRRSHRSVPIRPTGA
jgi:hypothetical protein